MAENKSRKDYLTLTRRVGNTNYKVRVHFNETGEETMEEKNLRMIQRDALNLPNECDIMNPPQMSRQSERSAS